MTKEMTYTSRPTRACLRSTEIPKNLAADFESDRYTREKLQKLTTALREHCEDTKERKAQLIKLPHGTVILVFVLPAAEVARLFWETNEAEQ